MKVLFTRKIAGENFTFYGNKMLWDNNFKTYYTATSEPNCFGYPNTIMLNKNNTYALDRYIAPYKLRLLERIATKKGLL